MKKNYKRLIMANFLGITITKENGHRWINLCNIPDYLSELMIDKKTRLLSNKVYGGLEQALNIIDVLLNKLGLKSLLEQFDETVDVEYDVKNKSDLNIESRVGVVN